jgi:hypothetical protein
MRDVEDTLDDGDAVMQGNVFRDQVFRDPVEQQHSKSN